MSAVVTMKTIAVRAGVTQATAAMCLAHNPRIPAAPRERIQGLARELDYQPKPDVSTLLRIRRQGKPRKDQPVVALVWAQRTEDGWRNHPAAIIRQMREGAFARRSSGCNATAWPTSASPRCCARGIRGLLLSPLAAGDPTPTLRWEPFSALCLGAPLRSLSMTTVCNDHYFSVLRTVRKCHTRGYRRPGLLLLHNHRMRC